MKNIVVNKIMKITLLSVLMLYSIHGFGQTLNDYLIIASQNNPEIKTAYSKFEAALQKAPQVSSLPNPSVTVSAFGRMIETRVGAQEARFTVMQMFPWFGTLNAKKDAANLMAEAAFQNYIDTRNEIMFNLKSLYAELYELQKMIELEEENLAILNTYKELALSKFKNAKGTMVDVVRIDIKRKENVSNIQILKDKNKPLQVDFNTMLNRDINESIVYPEDLPLTLVDQTMQTDNIFFKHPKMLMLDHEKAAFETEKIAVKKEGYPEIGIGLDYSIISKRNVPDLEMNGQDAIMPMLTVSLPIFRKKYQAANKQLDFEIQANEYEKTALNNALISNYNNATYDISKSKNLMELFESQIASTKQAVKLLIASFSNSGSDFDEILQMNQELLMYQKALATETKNQFIAQSKLEYLLSKTE